ncbi:MAG: hypothetical protein EZS28_031987 [Streblomastix strix]|uniref:Uncharacterized protein n=1 Tax=Streblomastix strix TaxID=222440 RepID=A0A5J4UP43_9EUKA|nr:MAG: hypothetical protein EZS28_031987 [Streblomastix strix]
MSKIGTARQLRYFLRQHDELYEIGTLALNKAINVKGYKISRRNDQFEERDNNYRDYIYQISNDGSKLSKEQREKGYILHQFRQQLQSGGTIAELISVFNTCDDQYILNDIAHYLSILFKAFKLPLEINMEIFKIFKDFPINFDGLGFLAESPDNHRMRFISKEKLILQMVNKIIDDIENPDKEEKERLEREEKNKQLE